MPETSSNPLTRFLEPDERVYWWQDRPAHRFSLPAVIPVAFSVSWTLLAFYSFWLTFLALVNELPRAIWYKPVASLLLTLTGIAMTIYSWREVRAAVPTTYLATNKAALIIEHSEPPQVQRFGRDAVARRIVFEDRIAFVDDVFDPRVHDKGSSFIGIEDIAAAEKALDRIARKIKKPDDGDTFFGV